MMGLPSELRLHIFKCMLESLSEPILSHSANEKQDLVSLMQVNQKFHSEISTILFRSPDRQIDAAIHPDWFEIFRVPYSTDLSGSRPYTQHHACMASQHCPERIMHLYLHISVDKMCTSDDDFFSSLVNLWYLAKTVTS
jgi:hypothetical protein